MKKTLKILALLWPIAALLLLSGYHAYMRGQIDKGMEEAHGWVWNKDATRFAVRIEERQEGELVHYLIHVTNQENKMVFQTSFTIDRDMFGGGFVKTMQVDRDPEKEVVLWGLHERSAFLDLSEGAIIKRPFNDALPEARALAKEWHRYHVMANFEIFILVVFTLVYYVLLGLILGIFWIFRRKKERQN